MQQTRSDEKHQPLNMTDETKFALGEPDYNARTADDVTSIWSLNNLNEDTSFLSNKMSHLTDTIGWTPEWDKTVYLTAKLTLVVMLKVMSTKSVGQ